MEEFRNKASTLFIIALLLTGVLALVFNVDLTIANTEVDSFGLGMQTVPEEKEEALAVEQYDGVRSTMSDNEKTLVTKHKITGVELASLKRQIGVWEEGQSYNQKIDGCGTGLRPPKESEWTEIADNAYVVEGVANSKAGSPSSVDQSSQPWFPPIGNQDGEGSCVAWAVGYYVKTFQEAKEHGWDLSGAEWEGGYYGQPTESYQDRIVSPDFIYHLINFGTDDGAYYSDAIELVCFVGASSWETMPYDPVDHTTWPSEEAWNEAPLFRGASSGFQYMYTDTDAGLANLKNWLAADNLAIISIDASQYSDLTSADLWTVDNYVSPSTNHANTIVGYDDSMEYVESGETRYGAFKVANSWGIGFSGENVPDGFYWISYEAMKQRVQYCMLYEDMIDYNPTLKATFQIDHDKRDECDIQVGIGDPNSPIATKSFSQYVDGGTHPFCENSIVFDITELASFVSALYSQIFFLRVYDAGTATTGTINVFEVNQRISYDAPCLTANHQSVYLQLIFVDNCFDFGTSGSPVEAGYIQVTETTLYSVSTGYGWASTAGLSGRDRGAPDDLRRDLVQSTTEHTFNIDLANGDYTVTITIGDQSYAHDRIDVYAETVLVIDNLDATAGSFMEMAFGVTITDEQLNVGILDEGGTDLNWVITALTVEPGLPPAPPTEGYFDFGTTDSPVESTYTPVTESTVYSAVLGYGWTSTTGLQSRDRGAPDTLNRDLVQSLTEHTFNVDLTNGDYIVMVTIGDQSYMHDLIDVYAEDALEINDLTATAAEFQESTFYTTVTDEQLNLRIVDSGGTDTNWAITALTIQPGSPPPLLTEAHYDFGMDSSPLETDYNKVTESTLYSPAAGYGWTSTTGLQSRDRGAPDDLNRDLVQSTTEHTFNVDLVNGDYTVTITIGDQSYAHDSIDVYAETVLAIDNLDAAAGSFMEITFGVTITDQQLNLEILDDGGTDTNWVITALTMQSGSPPPPPTEGHFDFGTDTSTVETGYTRVSSSTTYSSAQGYGWTSTAGLVSRDRGAPDDLKRDLVQSTTEHTFNVDLADGTYAVAITIGDQTYAHDNIDVYAEDVLEADNVNSAAGSFQEVPFEATVNDGQLNLRILDDGGIDANWVMNALTIVVAPP